MQTAQTMTTTALYKALIEAKVSDKTATEAVAGVASAEHMATKTDIARLETRIAQLETRMLRMQLLTAGLIVGAITLIMRLG